MARNKKIALRGVLLGPFEADIDRLLPVIESAASESGVELIVYFTSPDTRDTPMITKEILAEIMDADLIFAVISSQNPVLFYELGLASATDKPIILISKPDSRAPAIGRMVDYDLSPEGLRQLGAQLRSLLKDFRNNPSRFQTSLGLSRRPAAMPIIDLDRLEPREFENLCFELLTQMGFRRAEWGKEVKEVDVVATLPKKDPDGFEYDELWLISMGLHARPDMLLDMASDPEYLLRRLLRPEFMERFQPSLRRGTPVTVLFILRHSERPFDLLESELRHVENRLARSRDPFALRFRVWDREHLTALIQQYPQLAYKYFSEEGREQSKSRKTTEDFYKETVALNERLQATNAALKAANNALKEEREKRVRAERDAVWKDVAFKAAHKLGNPVFALETDLQGLKRRIEDRPVEAAKVAEEMGKSIEKAKGIIEQFKSLTRAQEISKRAIDLRPLIESASRVATENGVQVTVQANGSSSVTADPTRMTECFDELFANALHWLNKTEKRICILIDSPKKKDLPPGLNESAKYLRIRFEDNGSGVPSDMKKQIFAPFCTTNPHGTGLGLSVVERIIQGHDGMICETGKPGEGAIFEIFLPQQIEKTKE